VDKSLVGLLTPLTLKQYLFCRHDKE